MAQAARLYDKRMRHATTRRVRRLEEQPTLVTSPEVRGIGDGKIASFNR